MTTTPLHAQTFSELQPHLQSRALRVCDVVDAHLRRIAIVNDDVNAVVRVLDDDARQQAAALDDGPIRGPLHGLVVTVKESVDCVGSPTTMGIPALARMQPSQDAPVVERLRAAGAVVIGRTNMSELGLRLSTDNPLHGPTLNPYNPTLSAGGSSGGDGVAVATGMSMVGVGSDMGGSVRSPAFCCGVVGYKPSLGRLPRASSLPAGDEGFALQHFWVDGLLGRSIDDVLQVASVVHGAHPRDPRSEDRPWTTSPVPRRAGLVVDVPGTQLPSAVRQALQRAAGVLEQHGWDVVEVQLPDLDAVHTCWTQIVALEQQAQLDVSERLLRRPTFELLQRLIREVDLDDGLDVMLARRAQHMAQWRDLFKTTPVVLAPSYTRLPWPPDADLDAHAGVQLLRDTARTLTPANVLGLPALALPTDVNVVDDTLGEVAPVGVQLMADRWRDDVVLDVGRLLQSAVGEAQVVDPLPADWA